MIPPGLRAAHLAGLERVLAGAPSKLLGRRVESIGIGADGAEFPVKIAVTRTAHAPSRFTAWIRDLSERRAAEEESTRRKALLERAEQLAASEGVEIDTRDRAGLVGVGQLFRCWAVPRAWRGRDPPRGSGRPYPSRRPCEGRARDGVRAGRRRAPASGHPGRPARWHRPSPAGHERVEKRAKDEPRRLVGGVQDITEQRHAEREMAAHLAVSEGLSAWSSLEQGAERLLRDLCTALDYAVGTLLPATSWWRASS